MNSAKELFEQWMERVKTLREWPDGNEYGTQDETFLYWQQLNDLLAAVPLNDSTAQIAVLFAQMQQNYVKGVKAAKDIGAAEGDVTRGLDHAQAIQKIVERMTAEGVTARGRRAKTADGENLPECLGTAINEYRKQMLDDVKNGKRFSKRGKRHPGPSVRTLTNYYKAHYPHFGDTLYLFEKE